MNASFLATKRKTECFLKPQLCVRYSSCHGGSVYFSGTVVLDGYSTEQEAQERVDRWMDGPHKRSACADACSLHCCIY